MIEGATDCIFQHGGYKRIWRFHIESLDTVFSGNGRAILSLLCWQIWKKSKSRLSRNGPCSANYQGKTIFGTTSMCTMEETRKVLMNSLFART